MGFGSHHTGEPRHERFGGNSPTASPKVRTSSPKRENENQSIYILKNDLTNKLQQIVDIYARKDESILQKTAEINLQLRSNIDTIKSQEDQIASLSKQNQTLEKANHDYSTLINELQEKILVLEEVKRQEDRFDLVKVQANEIHQKDMEIERLQKVVNKSKESPKQENQTIDVLLQSVEQKSTAMKHQETKEGKEDDLKEESKEDLKDEDEEDIEVDTVIYKKKEYYYIVGDKEKHVYEILEDDELGAVFGKWKDVKGKKRVVPNEK